jgi:hypothetical protein
LGPASRRQHREPEIWEARVIKTKEEIYYRDWQPFRTAPTKTPIVVLFSYGAEQYEEMTLNFQEKKHCLLSKSKDHDGYGIAIFWRPWEPESWEEYRDTRIALRRKLNGDTR